MKLSYCAAMADPLRAVVVGTGFIGRVHARSARLAGARLTGVAASSPASAGAAAAALGADRAFASADEAVTTADADVVHLCTPNHLHEALALRALDAGKHVICEKPVALDAAGAVRVRDAGVAAGRLVAVPFVYRFNPLVREARAMAGDGRLGPIRLIHGTYIQDWLAGADATNWRVDAAQGGASRAFADVGSHWCDLVEFVTGHRIVRLVAHTSTFVSERIAGSRETFGGGETTGPAAERRKVDTEDAAMVLFETDRGAAGSVVVSQISPGRKNRLWFEVDGAEAAVAFDEEDTERLWIGRQAGNTIAFRDPGHGSPEATRLSFLPAGHAQGYADCFDLFVADAYTAMRSGNVPDGLPLVDAGVRTAIIVDAVLESAAARSWVDVRTEMPVPSEVVS